MESSTLNGKVIRGYELGESIGSGGMGAVYRAYQPAIDREVAIKVILPQYANQPEFIRSFETEAQLVARLEHPHIVPLYDFWRDPDGAYLVMRWIRSGSLRQLLRRDGALGAEATARILDQIASALSVAHRAGVVHRDIKPDNILMDDDLNAYLTDFGIATMVDKDEETDEVKGTLNYIAPEQLRGLHVSIQADIYALGLIIYECLTGRHVFEGATASELISKHLTDPIPDPLDIRPELPGMLNRVLQRATAKAPEDRYDDVRQMAREFRQIIAQKEPLESASSWTIVDEINPYKGLRAFDEADALDFYGREILVEALLLRLGEDHPLAHFLAVVGPSGSGKSSVVKAGLMPALRKGRLTGSQHWFMASMVPGEHPLQALEEVLSSIALTSEPLRPLLETDADGLIQAARTALRNTHNTLMLVIDQFEEVFTLTQDEVERRHFLTLLHTATANEDARIRIVVTLRADFYDRPLLYDGFAQLMQSRTQVVLPLRADEIERAIVGPARRVGLLVENELIAAMVADVKQEPGALPLLQYALTELYERQQNRTLTLDAYQSSGGVLGALARRAEEVYNALSAHQPTQRDLIRQLFLRLITLGEGIEDTRRRARLSELRAITENHTALQTILESFGRYRLLTFDVDPETREPQVEVAHEAIIREWNRLRTWLEESRDDVRLQRALATAQNEWNTHARDASYLLSGGRLSQYDEWQQSAQVTLTADEVAFLSASRTERERQQANEAARQTREMNLLRRNRRNLQLFAGVLGVGVLALLIAVVLAVNGGNLALQALATATVAQGQIIVEMENADNARETSVFEAENAATQERIAMDSAATSVANVATAMAAENIAERSAAEAQSVALAANAQQVLNGSNNDLAVALALEANTLPQPPRVAQDTLAAAAFSPGTRYRFTDQLPILSGAAYSPDGTLFAYAGLEETLVVRETATGAIRYQLSGSQLDFSYSMNSIAFSPDGRWIATGGEVGLIDLWDITTQMPIRQMVRDANGLVESLQFSEEGSFLLASVNRTAILYDTASGQIIRTFEGHQGEVSGAVFSPDQTQIATAGKDGILILWDRQTGEEIRRFVGHSYEVDDVIFNQDGTLLVSASNETDDPVIIWDVATGEEIRRVLGIDGVYTLALQPGTSMVAYGTVQGSIGLIDLRNGIYSGQINDSNAFVKNLVFSPDGRYLLSTTMSGEARLRYISSPAEAQRWSGSSGWFALSQDGETVFSGASNNTVSMWDIRNGMTLRRFVGHTDSLLGIDLSPDETRLLTGGFDGTVRLWDVATTQELHRYDFNEAGFYIWRTVFSPDGRYVVALAIGDNTSQGQIVLLNGSTLQFIRMLNTSPENILSIEPTDVRFSPDGETLFVTMGQITLNGESSGLIVEIDPQTNTILRTLSGQSDLIFALDFSPDGRYIATASMDRTAMLWDRVTGEPLRQFIGHTNQVTNVTFSPDGRYLLTSSNDRRIILWGVQTAAQVAAYTGHTDLINFIQFLPDGRYVLSSAADRTRRLWLAPLPGAELVNWIYQNRYVPELTCEQRTQYATNTQCDAQQNFATRTPVPTLSPTPTFTPSPTVDLTRMTATPTLRPLEPSATPTLTPTLTPIPSITPTPSPTGTPEQVSQRDIRDATRNLDFDAFVVEDVPGFVLSRALRDDLENYADTAFLIGTQTVDGDILFLQYAGGGFDPLVIQIRSPYTTVQDWATDTGNEGLAVYLEVEGYPVASVDYVEAGIYVAIVDETLVTVLHNIAGEKGQAELILQTLLRSDRIRSR
jgi:WD40 repeat protein/serine/threonine protein kinase